MSLDFLNEAFRKLDILNEDTFDASDDGVKELTALKELEDETENEINIIDPEAETQEDLKDSYIGKIILECPVCHSFVFNDKDTIDVDVDSKLANITQECPYCCEIGGFNIIGQVQGFEEEQPEDEVPAEEEIPAEDKPVEAEAENDESGEAEEVVEESLTENKCDETECNEECKDADCEEGLIGDVNLNLDAHDFGGTGNNVNVLGSSLPFGESCDEKCDDKCDNCDDCKDTDTLNEIGPIGAGLIGAGVGLATGAIGAKLLSDLQVVENNLENSISDVINKEFGIDNWTTFEYDDEEVETEGEGDEAKTKFVGTVKILNGDEELGEFAINDGKLIKVEDDADDEESDEDEESEEKDESVCPVCKDETCEIAEEVCPKCGKKVCECDGACKESCNEDLTIETSDDATVISDGEKEVTIEEAQPAEEAPVEETTEETIPEEASEETIVPLNDEEKEELTSDAEEQKPEETPAEEVDVAVDEIEEESFDRLGEKYLMKTYENVAGYKTTSATACDNKIKLEGVITFKSGKTKNTSFIFEARDITASGRARFVGENATFCKGKKAFTVTGALTEGKFLSESLNYNYSAKDVEGKSTRVYGTVSNKR